MDEIKQVIGEYQSFTDMKEALDADFEEESDNIHGYKTGHDCKGMSVHKKIPVKGDGIPRKCTPELMATCYYARAGKYAGRHCDYSGITGTCRASLGITTDACTLYVKAEEKAAWAFNKSETRGRKCGT